MKMKLRFLSIALALCACAYSVPAQVANLGIASAGSQSVLYWPTTLPNYILQSTINLASPNWVTVSNPVPVTVSNAFNVTITNASSAMFFRLIRNTASDGMAFIPAGIFTMGNYLINGSSVTNDPDITDANPTNVYVSAFYMDTNLVNYGQWQSVDNYATNNGYGFVDAGGGEAANHPVVNVDWYDTVKWCNARSQQSGLTPIYYTDAGMTQVYTNGETTNVFANWAANGYRLPTEAEWEKAARGGLIGLRFPWGNTISESQANYVGDTNDYSYDLGPNGSNVLFTNGTSPHTSPVGYFAPNDYGLYDMAGNVFEWCWDWYGTPYAGGNDPHGPTSGSKRVLRCSSWVFGPGGNRCAARNQNVLTITHTGLGFRCVRGQ